MNSRIRSRRLCVALGIAALAISGTAGATVHRVFPGQSIQAAIDRAKPGDTILVEPGTYRENGDSRYGLRISTANLRLIGKVDNGKSYGKHNGTDDGRADGMDHGWGHGKPKKVRLIRSGRQETGIYAAPAGCEYDADATSCPDTLHGFYVRGFSVEDFPRNGIQTRWVDGFEFVANESVRNLNNGIYPTVSANGLVRDNVSYGSLDTAMWVAASENVRVIGNTMYGSVIGFEITVSNNVWVTHNKIYDNTVGIGLFHPNGAGNPPLPVMKNWVIASNDVRDNNRPNEAPAGSFQSFLPPGIGILLAGVSDHVVSGNLVAKNDFVGIGVLGWCTANAGTPNACELKPPIADPAVNNNVVSYNWLFGNGGSPPPIPIAFLAADITYFEFEGSSGNCFRRNKPAGFTFVSSEPDMQLPTDGC
jgi:hypothetical protein